MDVPAPLVRAMLPWQEAIYLFFEVLLWSDAEGGI